MTDRDRLIDIIHYASMDYDNMLEEQHEAGFFAFDDFDSWVADDIIADGWIRPPCKVGDTVWLVRDGKIEETTVEKIVLKDGGLYLKLLCNSFYETTCRSIGKTVFLTKEEAEKALKEREGNG